MRQRRTIYFTGFQWYRKKTDCLLHLFHVLATLWATVANNIFYGITREFAYVTGENTEVFSYVTRGKTSPEATVHI